MDIVDAIKAQALSRSSEAVIVFQGETMTWLELWQSAEAFAAGLTLSGVLAGEPVVLALDPHRFLSGFVGCLLCGAIAVPLNPRATWHELSQILSATRSRRVVIDERAAARLRSTDADFLDYQRLIASGPAAYTHADLNSDCLIHFSSGSSGPPKLIPRSRLNLSLEGMAVRDAIELTSDDVLFCTTPLQHSYASGLAAAAIYPGALIVTVDDFKPGAILDLVEEHQVTILAGTPYLFTALAKLYGGRMRDLGKLRLCLSGGANLTSTLCQKFSSAFGLPITQEYGLSEGGIATFNVSAAGTKPLSCGRPIQGVELSIRAEDGRQLEPGEKGELFVKRAGMPRRYMLADSVADADFPELDTVATGDLAVIDTDGDLFIIGRRKLMINVAGNKVAPAEVAEILLEHPLVEDAVVVAVADEALGEAVGVAIIVRDNFDELALGQSITTHCRLHLSNYKVPRKIVFLGDFPRLPNNKVDLREITRLVSSAQKRLEIRK